MLALPLLGLLPFTLSLSIPRHLDFSTRQESVSAEAGASVSNYQTFNYGTDKIRGVNIGGWLVLETFLTPTIFSDTGNDAIGDEWTFCELQDRETAENTLRNHWDTYITEEDFTAMKQAGINHARIAVGFWSWDIQEGEPYISGAAEYLDKAIGWARNNDIKVVIDLHGAPGSQNGFDHSGHAGEVLWHTNPDYVKRTVDLIQKLSAKYGVREYADTVTMIELLNEPNLLIDDDTIVSVTKQYYLDAYEVARYPWGREDERKTDWIIVIHDGFRRLDFFNDFMTGPEFEKVWIDDHYYQAFDQKFMGISAEQHIRFVCDTREMYDKSPLPSFAGEWSLGVWNCAPAEGDLVGTCSEFDDRYSKFIRAFFDTQVQMYENVGQGQGWFFFNWKTEDIAEWSVQLGLERGMIPQPFGEYQFKLDEMCSSLPPA